MSDMARFSLSIPCCTRQFWLPHDGNRSDADIGPNVYVNVMLMSRRQLRSRFPATRDVRTALVEQPVSNIDRQWITAAVSDRAGNAAAPAARWRKLSAAKFRHERAPKGQHRSACIFKVVDEGSMPADSMRLPEVGFRYLRHGSSVSS
jgi:hypothetical protein